MIQFLPPVRLMFLASLLVCSSSTCAQAPVTTEIDGIRFTLADGLRIEKVATEPLIKWPIVVDWDPQGRLVVAESAGVARPIEVHNEQQLHRIVRLVDDDQDGQFDRRIVAADKLGFPEGVLCLGNDILVAAPPVIWKLTDEDGDGVCERRSVWFDGKTITGCANDLHGPYLGRDGWIYWCKGAFAEQTHQLTDDRELTTTAAHIFRRRLAGGPLEVVVAGGMDNPVEVAVTPEGEKFFTSTFLQHPADGLRDGIAHAVYGGVFGKDHAVLEGHIRTGPLMPIMTHLGPAAPAGLICAENSRDWVAHDASTTDRWLVAALFNLQKLSAHRLVPNGATFQTDDHDLVVADRVDFHPTDVIEDADGSLLLVDTGGWYDLCCPTSRIDQTTAAGGIYRITHDATDTAQIDRTAIVESNLDAAAACELLLDRRPWVRRSAGSRLQQLGEAAIDSLTAMLEDTSRPTDHRLTALWALCRVGTDRGLRALHQQLHSSNDSLVQAACQTISVHRYSPATGQLQALLGHDNARIRRSAAEALGRVGDRASAAILLAEMDRAGDRHLEHSFLYALIELVRDTPSLNLAELAESQDQLRAALIVHHQLGRAGQLDRLQVFDALLSDDQALRATAADVIASQTVWASDSQRQISRLCRNLDDETIAAAVAKILAGWRNDPAIQELVAGGIATAPNAAIAQQLFFASRLDDICPSEMPPSWGQPLVDWLAVVSEPVQIELSRSIANIKMRAEDADRINNALIRLAESDQTADRLSLLAAVSPGHSLGSPELEQELIDAFLAEDPAHSSRAENAFARIKLSDTAGQKLVAALDQGSPQSLMTAVEAIHRTEDDPLQREMLDRLRQLPAARTLPQSFLTNLYKKSPADMRKLAQATDEALVQPPADIRSAVDDMLKRLGPGNSLRGLQVFRSSKAACSACHRMGYIGNDTGPDLTRIGRSRTPEALLEAILFPSARQEQSFQSSQVMTVDGQTYNGLVKRSGGDSIQLQLNAQRTITIASEDIELIRPSEVSVMPSGLTEVLSEEDLADLMSLLRSAK